METTGGFCLVPGGGEIPPRGSGSVDHLEVDGDALTSVLGRLDASLLRQWPDGGAAAVFRRPDGTDAPIGAQARVLPRVQAVHAALQRGLLWEAPIGEGADRKLPAKEGGGESKEEGGGAGQDKRDDGESAGG